MSDPTRFLGTREAARLLDVGESTVKRWVDQGVLPAARTLGKHRKILLADLERVARDLNLPRPLGPRPPVPEAAVLAEDFYRALAVGDPMAAHGVLRLAHAGGFRVARLGDEVVRPAMARLGHGWETGELDVYEEHRGTQACLFALQALRLLLPEPAEGAPLAVGGGPEGDPSFLGSLLVGLVLREEGWATQDIGPDTPFASLARVVREKRPRLAWLSCGHLPGLGPFLAGCRLLADEARAAGTALLIGGGGIGDEARPHLPEGSHRPSLASLAESARKHAWGACAPGVG
ncbi:MAG: helix-turn-helix domain-containing protein [Gemmataceae bacterium]|nr:helix-turn-helix domain-containing protein [Gemmataceae bacterium]